MRIMYDSTRPAAIPTNAEMVAGYVDGIYRWRPEDWARFPRAVKVEISAIGTDRGTVVDVEQGCVWPPENAVPWVQRARARGVDPTVYCNWMNDLGPTRAAFDRAGVAQPHYWVAKYDGIAEIPKGTVGKQYRAPEGPTWAPAPGHYDMSAIADYWPGVDGDDMSEQAEKNIARILEILESANTGAAIETGLPNIGVYFREIHDAVTSMHRGKFRPIREGATGGDLTWFQEQSVIALSPVLEAIRAQPTGGQVDVPTLAALLREGLGDELAAALGRRLIRSDGGS